MSENIYADLKSTVIMSTGWTGDETDDKVGNTALSLKLDPGV